MTGHAPPPGPEEWIDRERLRAARKAAELSQERLAAAVGVTQQTVSHWETGTEGWEPNLKTALLLALALKTAAADLMHEKGREEFARLIHGALSTSAA